MEKEATASQYAMIELYFIDATASGRAKLIFLSECVEIEITSLLVHYLDAGSVRVKKLSRGYTWLDSYTYRILLDAGNFVIKLQRDKVCWLEAQTKLHLSDLGFRKTRCWHT